MVKVFMIHGWGGTPMHGWRPWLKHELEAKGFTVKIPAMPTTLYPIQAEWVKKISETVGNPDRDCILIGHSLGGAAILRYLETVNGKIGGSLLVAATAKKLGIPEISSFFKTDFDWEKIKASCQKFIVITSDNDKYIRVSHAEIFKAKLGAKILLLPGRGHFSGDEGCTFLPEALEAVMELTSLSE